LKAEKSKDPFFPLRCQYNTDYQFQSSGSNMRKITSDVYIENKYPAVTLGILSIQREVLLVDCPIRLEDVRSWINQASEVGKPRFTALLDHHPDRVVGARDLRMPLVGHRVTSQIMALKSDSFKGSAHPIGAETDRLKRVTGVGRAIPNLTFTDEMTIRMGEGQIEFWHRPGPTEGSIWVIFHKQGVIFIGDAVTVAEPPFIGDAAIDAWLETLDDLRAVEDQSYQLISSRDGLIEREDINTMARFLRKVQVRLDRLEDTDKLDSDIDSIATELLDDYKVIGSRKERARLRLRVGFEDLYRRFYDVEIE
jgi:glyoxylase-like metal-dependent hydrolase (beta-lactamase superfamily II)